MIEDVYRRYYTHTVVSVEEDMTMSRPRRVRRALRNGYLNSRYRTRFSPAWSIGSLLVPMLPCAKHWADRRMRHLRRPRIGQRILDVGCGNGLFLLDMRSAGWNIQGVDPDPAAVAAARAAGVPAEEGALENASFPPESFDAVTLNHVIEHLPDPRRTLRICHELLAPDGVLWVATPNLRSQSHRTFGKYWRGLEPPRHLVLFTAASLESTLDDCGFEVVAWRRDCGATAMFGASARIARKASPETRHASRSTLRIRALAADALGLVRPRLGEELIALATKRSGTS
jgi:2-polyprenyl-3-methyl-5-hydroxy-6-metoxy-1,4-benzoquinol methylase